MSVTVTVAPASAGLDGGLQPADGATEAAPPCRLKPALRQIPAIALVLLACAIPALPAADPTPPPPVAPRVVGGDVADFVDPTTGEMADFIIPIANDLRAGYSAHVGSYSREQGGGTSDSGNFIEHGLWVSYVRALTSPERAIAGRAEWRAEVGLLASQAAVDNSNGSTGTLQTGTLDLGIGPAWTIMQRGNDRLEIEIMPFVGFGRASYSNDFASSSGLATGQTKVDATGNSIEYGVKANLMWCWESGWGLALHAGLVQRECNLGGDSTTIWNNGTVNSSDYVSDDTLTGLRLGIFLAKRF